MSAKKVIIIGGGISGLSALHFIKQTKPGYAITLYEADNRLGGTIGTDKQNGYSFDWGPNGFLDREPLTLQLVDELGLTENLERAGANVSNRFILRKGKLRAVPMSPPAFVMSDVLSLMGKLRLFIEPLIKKGDPDIDESIYHFVERRIGTQAADFLVQPMVSGIYGGMADRLSLKSCFPIMHEMEMEYGGLFKAMIAKAKEAKAEGKKSGGPSGPGGWLTSFTGGLDTIVERFAERYSEHIKSGVSVEAVTKTDTGYQLKLGDGTNTTADSVVFATPSYVNGDIVRSMSQTLADAFSAIEYAPIDVVCFGFDESNVGRKLDGFGFLVPSKEKLRILGSIWTSSIFINRAPDGKVQLRSMVGGDGDHKAADLSDDQLTEVVYNDLDKILGLNGKPEIVKIFRWAKGIPQFKIGHANRMSSIESELSRLGNLHITGNAYYGIGLNDCVKQSFKVAQAI